MKSQLFPIFKHFLGLQVGDKHKIAGAAASVPVAATKEDSSAPKPEQETAASPPQAVGQ